MNQNQWASISGTGWMGVDQGWVICRIALYKGTWNFYAISGTV